MTQSLALLDGHKYVSLTTFRKSGEPKPTAVWFTTMNGNIYIYTAEESWKVKRIKNNANVEMTPCTSSGELLSDEKLTGTARLLDANEEKAAIQSFKKKYGMMKSVFDIMGKLRGDHRIYIEIVPQNGQENG